jgi:hypothetical protein
VRPAGRVSRLRRGRRRRSARRARRVRRSGPRRLSSASGGNTWRCPCSGCASRRVATPSCWT